MLSPIATTLDELHQQCQALEGIDPDYAAKMIHQVPQAPVVNRLAYVLQVCQGKRVLHLGCGWPLSPLHTALQQVCASLDGVDILWPQERHGKRGWRIDLDEDPPAIPQHAWEVILVAEILEHLGNPGRLLKTLRQQYWGAETRLLITVPNAFTSIGTRWLRRGWENVNREHTCWYSYRTLLTLIERYGYTLDDWAWYNGAPGTAEGLIFLAK